MRRIKCIVALGIVTVAMLALSAGPAMADEWNDWNDLSWNDHNGVVDGYDEVIWLPESSPWYDQLCSPGLPDGYWLPGCIFSDPIEEEHFFDEAVFVIDDIDVDFKDIDCDDDDCGDDDCDDDDDHFRGDDWRFHDDW